MARGWSLSDCNYTYRNHQTCKPDCIYRPLWVIKCQYQDQTFDTVVDASRIPFWQNLPQDTEQIKKIKELDYIIGRTGKQFWIWVCALGLVGLFFIIMGLALGDTVSSSLGKIFLFIGVPLIITAIIRDVSAKSAKKEKENTLSGSKEKRKQAAIKRFGSDPELVAMLND